MNDDTLIFSIDQHALASTILQQGEKFSHSITERHDHLFATNVLVISQEQYSRMQAVISAVEDVVSLPVWNINLDLPYSAKGVFFGYDFHLNDSGVHLIEINTNAGGAFLNALLLQSQQEVSLSGRSSSITNLEQSFVEMFRNEWHLEQGDVPLKCIAIVDEKPLEQYLYPEFILAKELFEQAGIQAEIERYMAIPGQALCYKIGQMAISAERKKYEMQLGTKFNIASFHTEVLKDGCVPLNVLSEKMADWAKK